MVVQQASYPQFTLILLGASAVMIFLAARVLRITNKVMGLLTALAFLLAGGYIYFEPQLLADVPFWSAFMEALLSGHRNGTFFYVVEPGAKLLSLLICLIAACAAFFSAEYLKNESRQQYFYPLLLLMIVGLIGMLQTSNLLVLYLFCELMSISAYTLVAFRRKNATAIEAGFKYLMMGSVASVILLAGISILMLTNDPADGVSLLGVLLMLTGLALKSALVPLHTWLPDAHGKAPSSISAMLSGVLVESVFYIMLRTSLVYGIDPTLLGNLLLFLAIGNIILGNLMGVVQKNLKRMLGYSTIAQMGYIALCFAIGLRTSSALALETGFFIILAHALTKSLAFLGSGTFYHYEGVVEVKDLRKQPGQLTVVVIVMALAILNLAAVPPLPGFIGKWTLLTSVFATNDPLAGWITFVVLAGSLVAFGYYLPLLISLLSRMQPQGSPPVPQVDPVLQGGHKASLWIVFPMVSLAVLTLLMMIFPQWVLNCTVDAVTFFQELIA